MKTTYLRKEHMQHVNNWLIKRSAPTVARSELPVRTFIVPGVACMGVRMVEGGHGIIDSVATNPLVSSATRHKALESLYDRILAMEEFKMFLGMSEDMGMLERSYARGFRPSSQLLMVRS